MFVIFCRIFQFIFNYAAKLLPWRRPVLIDGQGSIFRITDLLKLGKVKKPMIVTGENLVKAGVAQRVIDILENAKFSYVIFSEVEPNPSVKTVNAIQELYLEHGCDGFIALGGGSPIDAAKGAAARVVKPNKTVNQLGGLFKVSKKMPHFIAIPTTAGTGSETTIAALITDTETRHKYAILDINLVPRFAILDPDLTVSLPRHVTSTTGMDALTHAVEAYLCWTYNTAESIQFALDAVRLIFANLEKAYNDGNDIKARQAMLAASFKAGFAFTRSGVGNVHAIAHTLGGLYNTPHGLANAVILPKVLENYGERAHKKLAHLAEAAGLLSGSHAKTNAEKAQVFIDTIYGMNERMGIPKGFDFINNDDIDQMIIWADKESNPIYPVPVIFNKARFRKVIENIRQE